MWKSDEGAQRSEEWCVTFSGERVKSDKVFSSSSTNRNDSNWSHTKRFDSHLSQIKINNIKIEMREEFEWIEWIVQSEEKYFCEEEMLRSDESDGSRGSNIFCGAIQSRILNIGRICGQIYSTLFCFSFFAYIFLFFFFWLFAFLRPLHSTQQHNTTHERNERNMNQKEKCVNANKYVWVQWMREWDWEVLRANELSEWEDKRDKEINKYESTDWKLIWGNGARQILPSSVATITTDSETSVSRQ